MARVDAVRFAEQLQARLIGSAPQIGPQPEDMVRELRKILVGATDDEALLTPPHEVGKLLFDEYDKKRQKLLVNGGRRDSKTEVYRRADNALINFSVSINYAVNSPQLIAYSFHIKFPDGSPLSHLRYDLDPPNEEHDVLVHPRCHLHPGCDVRAAAPLAHPLELLSLLIYGL